MTSSDTPPGPVVSCQWLAANADRPNLTIVDIRSADEYAAGHLPGSVSIPFDVPVSTWISAPDGLLLELPDTGRLFEALGAAGITRDSHVVVVGAVGQPPFPQAGATRVAQTLAYAGVANASILDGGFPRWAAEGLPTTTEVPTPRAGTFTGAPVDGLFVDREYVERGLGELLLVDNRDAAVYSGDVVEPWADKAGHIPTARSLPAEQIWNADGTYRDVEQLRAAAEPVVGADRDREVVLYCGVGGYASSWQFVLNRLLGYRDVKLYDGSAQEWVRHHDMER